MATIVVQDDKILRFLQVILDPDVAPSRVNAFRDYLAFDIPDPDAWFEEQRQRATAIYPSRILMVEDEDRSSIKHLSIMCRREESSLNRTIWVI